MKKQAKQSTKRLATVLVGLLIVTVLLSACTLQIGWLETSLPGNWHARYRLYSGSLSKGIEAQQGQTIRIDYDSEVTAGELTIQVTGPDGTTVADIPVNETGQLAVEAKQNGGYRVQVKGNRTRGRFSLKWEVE